MSQSIKVSSQVEQTTADAHKAATDKGSPDPSQLENLSLHASRLETLLKNLPGMAYRCLNQSHWPMDFVSQGCFELCGYHREEIESQQVLWGDFTHPDDVGEVDRIVRAATSRGDPFEVEYRIITKDGTEKWVWERGRPVDTSEDGVAILEGLITDITDRKQFEAALVDAKAYSDAVVESAAEGIITVDAQGRIESFNRAAQVIFMYTLERIIGKHCRLLFDQKYHALLMTFIATQYSKGSENRLNLEAEGRKSDNSLFPIQFSLNIIDNLVKNKYVILVRDLTVRRTAENEVRKQREILAHADRLNTLGEMAAAIAHEINQPLTALSMYAKSGLTFMEQGPNMQDNLRKALIGISTQAQRAGVIMERTRTMTSLSGSARELIDIQALLDDVHDLAKVEARIRDFQIILDVDDELPPIHCDCIQIQQVILNLLRNGMESMTLAGRRSGSAIGLRAKYIEHAIKIDIEDCGHGVSTDLAAKLYQPFVTTKPEGMGLGLSISRSIIASHNGKLEHINNKHGGATFSFSLRQEDTGEYPLNE